MLRERKKEAATSAQDFRSRPIGNTGHGPADGRADSDGIGDGVTAERVHVGDGIASNGTTVFGGARLSAENQGSVQIRAGAARLLLLSASSAMVNDPEGLPSAIDMRSR